MANSRIELDNGVVLELYTQESNPTNYVLKVPTQGHGPGTEAGAYSPPAEVQLTGEEADLLHDALGLLLSMAGDYGSAP